MRARWNPLLTSARETIAEILVRYADGRVREMRRPYPGDEKPVVSRVPRDDGAERFGRRHGQKILPLNTVRRTSTSIQMQVSVLNI
jgi:hypothetical protein